MSNDRVNLPGGVDKIGHSSIQPWSAGDLFPAVLARVERGDSVLYEVVAYGELYKVGFFYGGVSCWACRYDNGSMFDCAFDIGTHADLYDAAAQFALGLVMAHAVGKEPFQSLSGPEERVLDRALSKSRIKIVDMAAAQAALEAGFPQMEKDLAAMGAIPAPAPYGWASTDLPVTPEEEAIPADYWMEKKALLCSDHPAEDPPVAVSWLERRPARDCGIS